MIALLLAFSAAASAQYRATSEQTVGGFVNPESVGCDARNKVLYVGNFGAPKLDPAAKDGMGYISKVGLDGKVIEKQFLPAAGGEKLNKPKGIWIQGDRLWVTDIDVVWVFDLKTKKGRKFALPGVVFANDPAVMDGALYVSDNRADKLVKVEPADFLNMKGEPKLTADVQRRGRQPERRLPDARRHAADGRLRRAGQAARHLRAGRERPGEGALRADRPAGRPLPAGRTARCSSPTGTRARCSSWTDKGELRKLADGFKGPADFCVMPNAGGLTVFVPDLVQSQLRIVQLRK